MNVWCVYAIKLLMLRSLSSVLIALCIYCQLASHQNSTTQASPTTVSYEVSRWNYVIPSHPSSPHPTCYSQWERLKMVPQPTHNVSLSHCIWFSVAIGRMYKEMPPNVIRDICEYKLAAKKWKKNPPHPCMLLSSPHWKRRRRSDSRWRIWAKAETLSADMNNGTQLHSSRHPKKTHWKKCMEREGEKKKNF